MFQNLCTALTAFAFTFWCQPVIWPRILVPLMSSVQEFSAIHYILETEIILKVLLGSTMYSRKLFVYLCLKTYLLTEIVDLSYYLHYSAPLYFSLMSCCDHKSSLWFWSFIACGLCKVHLEYCAVQFRARTASCSRYICRAGLQLPLSNPFLILWC
jgi:hypothetical protein